MGIVFFAKPGELAASAPTIPSKFVRLKMASLRKGERRIVLSS